MRFCREDAARGPTQQMAACNFCSGGKSHQRKARDLARLSVKSWRKFDCAPYCTATFFRDPIFFIGRSNGCRAMPAAHDAACKFVDQGAQPASACWRCVLDSIHLNKGGTCRGPFLETECTGGVRRVCFRRRDFAGSILSSRGRRRRQTKQ